MESKTNSPIINEEAVMMLSAMGFPREKAVQALTATNGDVERATDWIFSHMDDTPVQTQDIATQDGKASKNLVFVIECFSLPVEGIHFSHGNFNFKWSLCLSHKTWG